MEVLSEHQCEGWLEGYLLTGRHGLFNCYEAFIHIVDSMFNQHAKWLKVTVGPALAAQDRVAELSAGLARLAAGSQRLHASGSGLHRSCGQQEGRSRARLSAAGCQLPAVGDGSLPAQPALRQCRGRRQASGAAMADMDAAVKHCTEGIGIWQWASNDQDAEPDVVMACCGRCADAGNAGGGFDPARASARAENPRGQRRRSDEAAAADRASARPERSRISMCSSPKTSRSSSPFTAIRG